MITNTIESIMLDSIEKVKLFVSITNKYKCSSELHSGRYSVDAKSIMGVFSLDLNKPLAMLVYADDEEFDELFSELLNAGIIV